MQVLPILISVLFAFSLFSLSIVFLLYPLCTWLVYLIKGKNGLKFTPIHPSISMIIAVHNAEDLIIKKIRNALSLNYPSENYEIIIFSDGSNDKTEERIVPFTNDKVRFFSTMTHKGKYNAINKAMLNSNGEIIVFSDVDAILEKDAIPKLVKYFSDPSVGGVCGQRMILEDDKSLSDAQDRYIKFDRKVKMLENKIGSISSNDGKLYAIRKELFQPIPPAVTDDLYICLSIVKQNYFFLFESNAKTYVKLPSRNTKHEIQRRRRIVSTSLRGIFMMKTLLNPAKYGMFSISIIINKVIRRFLPISLLTLLISNLILSFYIPFIRIFLYLQTIFYVLALVHTLPINKLSLFKHVSKVASVAYYFCIGNYGTLLGFIDFIMNRPIIKWEPIKDDKLDRVISN